MMQLDHLLLEGYVLDHLLLEGYVLDHLLLEGGVLDHLLRFIRQHHSELQTGGGLKDPQGT